MNKKFDKCFRKKIITIGDFLKTNFKIIDTIPMGGDCCCHYFYEAINPVTVQELCDRVLSDASEWGKIGLAEPNPNQEEELTIKWNFCVNLKEPYVRYNHGKYINEKGKPIAFQFPPKIANAIIKRIEWHGGWTSADYIITI